MKVIAVNGKILLANGKAVKPPNNAVANLLGYTLSAPSGLNYTGFVHSWNSDAANAIIVGDGYTKGLKLVASRSFSGNTTSEIQHLCTPIKEGHKYYFQIQQKANKVAGGYTFTSLYKSSGNRTERLQFTSAISDAWETFHRTFTGVSSIFQILLGVGGVNGAATGDYIEWKNILLVDLTETYGSGFEPTEEECAALFANYVADGSYVHFLKKYYYNGVLLPELPADVLAQYPYAWIRNNTRTGYYDLCLSSSLWYASDADTISTDSYNTTGIQWYRVTKSAPEEVWVFNQAWTSSGGFGNESDRHIMWSNHDIPNGSATATEIYFEGSEPVLAE